MESDIANLQTYMNNMASMPSWSTTTDRATAQALLKYEWIFCRSDRRDIRVKHLGLGVYKVYTVKWESET